MSTHLSSKIVKTKIKHVWWGCGRVIPVGVTVTKANWADAGTVDSVYWCEPCNILINKVSRDSEFSVGELRDNNRELWDEINNKLIK